MHVLELLCFSLILDAWAEQQSFWSALSSSRAMRRRCCCCYCYCCCCCCCCCLCACVCEQGSKKRTRQESHMDAPIPVVPAGGVMTWDAMIACVTFVPLPYFPMSDVSGYHGMDLCVGTCPFAPCSHAFALCGPCRGRLCAVRSQDPPCLLCREKGRLMSAAPTARCCPRTCAARCCPSGADSRCCLHIYGCSSLCGGMFYCRVFARKHPTHDDSFFGNGRACNSQTSSLSSLEVALQ